MIVKNNVKSRLECTKYRCVKKDEFTINTGQTNSKKRESLLNKTVIMAQPLNKLGCKKFLSIIIK